MIKQLFALCLIVVLSAQAKYYAVDKSMQVKEIPSGIADFVLNDPSINAFIEFKDDHDEDGSIITTRLTVPLTIGFRFIWRDIWRDTLPTISSMILGLTGKEHLQT